MHLDSIFDGFQKLISGSDESREQRQLPFVIEKTIHNILFIKTHMQRQDEFDAVSKKHQVYYVHFPFWHWHCLLSDVNKLSHHWTSNRLKVNKSLDAQQSLIQYYKRADNLWSPSSFCSRVSTHCVTFISHIWGERKRYWQMLKGNSLSN